jgi:GTPase
MLPLVVIAGRPNVGKSTLFNRLAGKRLALVADTPGVTRDRKEAEALLRGRHVRLVDTAGLEEAASDTLPGRLREGAGVATAAADLVLFVVDARAGVTPADSQSSVLDAFELGLGEPIAVSAEHGEGLSELMSEIAERLPGDALETEEASRALKLAIVGRPNAGKSTLLNRLVGEERMLTGPEPGLTRDAVSVVLHDAGGPIELVDTAGLRRKARVEAPLEKLAVGAAINALKLAEVVVLVVDATEGLHDQDLQIAQLIEREGRACVIAFNKWDAVENRQVTRRAIGERLEMSLAQMRGITVVPLSAMTGAGMERLLPAVRRTHEIWNTRVPTAELNRWFEHALARHPPPLVSGRRLKLRYITQAKARPPTFVVFGTRAERLPEDYQRYLVNSLREAFDLPGTPIRVQLRGTKNPYAGG